MASSDKQKNAERVRWAERERMAQRDYATAAPEELDPLTMDGLIPGDTEGLRPASSNDLPLVVNIPVWKNLPPFLGADSTVRIEWAREGESSFQKLKDQSFPYPQNRDDFPKPVTLDPFDKDMQGRFNLRWSLKLFSDPGFVSESTTSPLRIDRTPPYDLANPAEFILAANEINDAYLAANGNKVIVEIPAYPDYAAGDTISYGWQKVEPINPEDIVPITPSPVAIPPDRKLEIPLSLLADGPAFCAYRLFDKAGNPSRLSHMRLRNVALGAFPVEPLDPPTVPLAEDDGLIDQLDAASREVAVVIPEVNNGKTSDLIYVTWGTQELEGHPVVPRAETRIKIPLEVLKAQYTQATGEQPTPVKYEVRRGTRAFGAPGISVKVDFSRIGPVNPDWPNITNPNLGEVEVRGDSDLENELNLTDANKDANVLFTLYDPPVAGDEIHVIWGGVPVLPVTTITTETAGMPMEIPVPWSVIDGRSNDPALPVFYWLRRPGFINAERSKTTPVEVNVHTIVPDAAQFPDKAANDFMFCHLLDWDPVEGLGIKVHIPANPRYLKKDVEVTVKWQGHKGYDPTGAIPADPIAGTDLEYTFAPLTAEQVRTGLDWIVRPYATKILPLYGGESDQVGRGIVSYTVSGVTSPSPDATLNVALGTGSGTGTCPIERS
ncbi:hypothetical protein J2W17_006233 [Pseudomonas lini]|uniref:hypothetical protein n=1 Tax=Pseudomonas lini TaxID=163011 RepID=UPI00277D7066|nr:hypothetical protein [Pseudomonas lini]MDQ0127233.1 hypothetical protein [Pseudomonas lini]